MKRLSIKDRQLIYESMVAYLEENGIRLKKEYFSGIIKAVGMVVLDGDTVYYACSICSHLYDSDETDDGHLDEEFMRKHVRAIVKRICNF